MCDCVLRHYGRELLDLLRNIDKLLATDEHFLLGVWLESAKNMSTDGEERRLYEYSARNQITLWGPDGNVCRWHLLFNYLHHCLSIVCSFVNRVSRKIMVIFPRVCRESRLRNGEEQLNFAILWLGVRVSASAGNDVVWWRYTLYWKPSWDFVIWYSFLLISLNGFLTVF